MVKWRSERSRRDTASRPGSEASPSPYRKPPLRIQTTTLWDYPSQHYGTGEQGSKDYAGATPSYVIWNLIQRYTKPGELIVDPFCGSGATLDVAADTGRRALGFDLALARPDLVRADARALPLPDHCADLVFMDPPYATHLEYSGHERCIGELSAWDGSYYDAMAEVIAETSRVLKPGRIAACYVSDSYRKGRPFAPIGFQLFALFAEDFEPVDIVVVTRHNRKLKQGNFHRAAEEGNFFLRGFNYLLIFRHPG